MALLEVKNATKTFGKLIAVNNLSFEVERGEIFGIAGPNGAGKTTLFNIIEGTYPYFGEILFMSQKISGLKPHKVCRRGIARTFQTPLTFPSLTVGENIQIGTHFGNREKGIDRDRMKKIIKIMGLQGKEQVSANRLPLFDKKITMLAAALATNPQLLLLDEPAGGLSPIEINKSIELFKKLNEEFGITIIIIEHLMKVLMEISRRLMIIHNGQKIALGLPDEIAHNNKVIEVYLGEDYAKGTKP
jgi:branched-chain amino acid transport system ATP-binding protein